MSELNSGLEELYGGRLIGVYIFGSYARGDSDLESDVDVLVVLDTVGNYAEEVDLTGYLISNLSLKYGVSVSRVFVPHNDWLHSNTPFMTNVRRESVTAA
ncbi:nucleotidyltransferase domain-containing protein [Candidatus Magnetomonas plexicatena]|uniref:nucleotidyltransferase domain-containing protein n=1 Tax=Candidatus Magnetomonas plexicatena TaxID=2552947 RepID=UPI001C7781CB|nr:nucleotidyltransferase domain-containing protein [Nitrospirales bacterium LBB_01]